MLRQTLLLLHPFIPFITEELWNQLGYAGPSGGFIEDARLDDASQSRLRAADAGRRARTRRRRPPSRP